MTDQITPGTTRLRIQPEAHVDNGTLGAYVVTSVKVAWGPGHATLSVYNRGGLSGMLVVDLRDGEEIAGRLIPEGRWVEP